MKARTYDNVALQKHLRERPDLTLSERALAYTLATFRSEESGLCYPSQYGLARLLGCSRKHISCLMKRLRLKGVLSRKEITSPWSRKHPLHNFVFSFDKKDRSKPSGTCKFFTAPHEKENQR